MLYVSGNAQSRKVKVNGKLLNPEHSLKVINHSPDGFAWGYEGSACAQLALALLLLRTDEENASRLHQDFKKEFVSTWKTDKNFSHKIPIDRWLRQHEAKVITNDADLTDYIPEKGEEIGRTCGSFCTTAKSKDCSCSCGGENHGKDLIPTVGTPTVEPKKKTKAVEAKEAVNSEPASEPYQEPA